MAVGNYSGGHIMKIFQINIFGNLSTGRVAVDIYKEVLASGNEGKIAFARNQIEEGIPHYIIGRKRDIFVHGALTRFTDRAGLYSKGATKRLIYEIEEYNPDIIHLHNIHGYYLNIVELFLYLKEKETPVVWTLHDCWACTGHCCYFEMVQCEKWKTHCQKCPQKHAYPASILADASYENYELKKELFTGKKIHLVTVSRWLQSVIEESFLREQPIETIYNGIDLNVFKPSPSLFRKKHGLEKKKIILGVASTWDTRKGFDDFLKLSKKIDDNTVIVLVGVSDKEKKRLHPNMIGISRTGSTQELVEIYSTVDYFFNASIEETFGLPTLEAMACGTPSIVYNCTAMPEIVSLNSGYIVKPHDLDAIVDIVQRNNIMNPEDCIARAKEFERHSNYQKYIELYERILNEKR